MGKLYHFNQQVAEEEAAAIMAAGVAMPTLGTRIRELRERQGIPQEALADCADDLLDRHFAGKVRLRQSHLSQIELDKVRMPDARRLWALAHCLGVPFELLIGAVNADEERRTG